MQRTQLFTLILLACTLGIQHINPAVAKSTRTFSGDNPGEVEKNAKKAGFDTPDGEMKCNNRCNQRWAKE